MGPDLGYKLLECLCPFPPCSSLKLILHEATAVATIYDKGSEASKVGRIANWHRPPFVLYSYNFDTWYMCKIKAITTASFRAHNHISSSVTQVTATNRHMTRKPNAHQFLRDGLCAAVGELDAIFGMIPMHAWGWPWQLYIACRDCFYC